MRGNLIVALSAITALSATASAHAQQDIVARDGDRIIVDEDARVEIVRRRQAAVRTIFNQQQRLLIVLVDYVRPGAFPDGTVDWAFNFYDVEGDWPLGERWEALTTLLQYDGTPTLLRGLALETPQGLVQLWPSRPTLPPASTPSARAVLSFRGSSSGGRQGLSFTEAETLQLQDHSRSTASGATVSTLMGDSNSTSGTGAASLTGGVRGPSGAPRKIRNVAPNYPEAARQARVSGVVILQLTVSANGIVTDARVLRSIPLLDAAAIEAAKLWQYEPRPGATPLTLTAAVPFTP